MTEACGGMQSMDGKMTYALVYSCIGSVVGERVRRETSVTSDGNGNGDSCGTLNFC